MANSPVKLKIDGFQERDVLMVTYGFNQQTAPDGQMAGVPHGGKITVRVAALNDGNAELLHWMVQRAMAKNGNITFQAANKDQKMKDIEFKDAYCIDYREYWEEKNSGNTNNTNPNSNSTNPHYEEIVISCREIKNGPVTYTNEWA